MPFPILATKLHVPTPRPKAVPRHRLIDQLDRGLESRLTLIAAPPGFGKTTLLSEWIAKSGRPVLWLSLDDGDNDPARFLAYLVASLRPLAADPEKGHLGFLRTPMPPSTEAVLTALVNGIADSPEPATLVLDDYHAIHSEELDRALAFFIEHAPPRLHEDTAVSIRDFTGGHHFITDFLIEEVLQRQPERIQSFLLRTSVLNRLCGPLCDALFGGEGVGLSAPGEETLSLLHRRASLWYKGEGLEVEAFHHAVAAGDVELASRLVLGEGMPLPFWGAVMPVLD